MVPLAWNRTRNLQGTDLALCRLSYSGEGCSCSIHADILPHSLRAMSSAVFPAITPP